MSPAPVRRTLDLFNLVASSIVDQVHGGMDAAQAVSGTLGRWRRFWAAAPAGGLTPDQIRGLFAELWFLSVSLLPRGAEQVRHWFGPTGARHDFQWPGLAVEVKETTSVRGHVHRINGIDQLDPPAGGQLYLFSLRLRDEAESTNSTVVLVDQISLALATNVEVLDVFESRLMQTGYLPTERDRYGEMRFRVINERLYRVDAGFPRLSAASFAGGVPSGIERIEYEINLDAAPQLLVATSPAQLDLPS